METALYLLTLFSFLLAGMAAAKFLVPGSWSPLVDRALGLCLYLLLFFMGVRTGLIEDIGSKLSMIGIQALLFALVTSAGSAGVVILLGKLLHSGTKAIQRRRGIEVSGRVQQTAAADREEHIFVHLREPLKLLVCVAAGALLAAGTPLFSWFSDGVTNTVLYILLFLVGMQMVQGNTDVVSVLKDPVSILLPLGTIVGTLLFSALIPLFTDISLFESLAVASGFGWYSLSGVIITELGNPVLGSVAFLSNLFRESIAFLTIPFLASYGRYRAAISVCGATSMDVTLPSVERNCGPDFVPLSVAHGIVLSLVVPFLVPFFYSFAL